MDFQKEVINQSFDKPVLVDFWAPWCGPCRVLGPILEQIAMDQFEKFDLIKINTEDFPQLAQEYGIYSIPNVKLFYKGEVINEFAGALPKAQIEKWLIENLPDKKAPELEYLLSTANEIPDESFIERLSLWLSDNPDSHEGRIALASHMVWIQPEDVEGILQLIKMQDEAYERAAAILSIAEFRLLEFEADHPAGTKLIQAQEFMNQQDFVKATQLIIDAVSIDKSYHEDMPRLIGISLFHYFGQNHPITREYRKLFDMMIW